MAFEIVHNYLPMVEGLLGTRPEPDGFRPVRVTLPDARDLVEADEAVPFFVPSLAWDGSELEELARNVEAVPLKKFTGYESTA